MAQTVLVAGSTGYVGRHVVAELHRRGHRVRALARSRERAELPGAHGAPALAGLVDEWLEVEVTRPGALEGACDGVHAVISALGVTRQKADPWDVDFLANLRLLEEAEGAAVDSFCYVNVMHVHSGTSTIMRAKAAFVEALRRSRVSPRVVNPSGYFSDISEFLAMARAGLMVQLGAGGNRLNPIHGADLASFCVDRATGDEPGQWDVGGPDVFSYRGLEELAFHAAGRKPRILTLPRGLLGSAVWVADRVGPRPANLARFFTEAVAHDAVGTPVGTHHVRDHFQHLLVARPGPGTDA